MARHLALAAATLFFTVLGPEAGQGGEPLTSHQLRARAILRELVEIDTSPAHGTTAAVEALVRRLEGAGFGPEQWAILGPTAERMNLVFRYPAMGPGGRRCSCSHTSTS